MIKPKIMSLLTFVPQSVKSKRKDYSKVSLTHMIPDQEGRNNDLIEHLCRIGTQGNPYEVLAS